MLTYRMPRMLHWLANGGWLWIHTYNQRMNYSATGWEWAAMPLLLLRGNTSWFFLLNVISYLLLPGLVFAVLRQFSVGGRVAWTWMWLFPCGLNFVMQAGSGANDTISVVYLLSALYFAGRARTRRSIEDVRWSVISAVAAERMQSLESAADAAVRDCPTAGAAGDAAAAGGGDVVASGCAIQFVCSVDGFEF